MSKQAQNVLLAGGTGFVGQAITQALKTRGHRVTWISRKHDDAPHGPPDDVDILRWDKLKDVGLSGWDAVCNVTGCNVLDFTRRWTSEFKDEVRQSRIGTTDALVKAIAACPQHSRPTTYVGISGVGYYPYSATETYTEAYQNNHPRGSNFMVDLVKDWEAASSSLLTLEPPVRRVIIRSGVVLGSDGGAFKKMYLPFFLGLGGPHGSGQQPFPWIHQFDLAQLFVHTIENPDINGVLNGTAPDLTTNMAFIKELARQMHRPACLPVPGFILNLLLSSDRSNMLLKGQYVKPERTLQHAHFSFRFPTAIEAIKDLVVSSE